MKNLVFDIHVDLSKEKVWQLFVNPKSYSKYFKYIKKVFYKGEMKLGFIWFDLATVVYFPAIVMHKVTKFEKEKTLQFYVPLPLVGGIRETVDIREEGSKTHVKAIIEYEFGPIFGPIFNNIFEKRFTEMIKEGIEKFEREG